MRSLDRLLVLGLDGATWTVLDAMRGRGVMPHLDRLFDRTANGTLRSSIPPMTAAAWTTMQTGCSPVRHGIFDHRYLDLASGRMKINHAGRIRVPTTWQILDEAGLQVISLNLPGTYPPPRLKHGLVVSGMDAPHIEAALAGCPDFADRLRVEAPDYTLQYHWKRAPLSLEELAENARRTTVSFHGRASGALAADRHRPDWSVLMVQFQNLDPFQHRAWRYLNVDETGIEDPAWNRAAEDVLRGLDAACGCLLELADRRGAGVLVVSDHGFGKCKGRIHVNRILIAAGLARTPGPLGRIVRRGRQALDHYRVHRDKSVDPNARSASFELSVAAQFPFDWSHTLAFAPHQDTAAMIYLPRDNQHLRTDRAIEQTRNRAALALAQARHPETDTPLFPEVFNLAEAYQVDPAALGYPDLLALPDENYWVRTKLAPGRDWVEPDANLPGTHRPEGVVALAAPGLDPATRLQVQLQDVAPSILSLLGQAVPGHMEGRPFPGLTQSRQRQDAGASATPAPHHHPFDYTEEEQAILEQRLADLGYLE